MDLHEVLQSMVDIADDELGLFPADNEKFAFFHELCISVEEQGFVCVDVNQNADTVIRTLQAMIAPNLIVVKTKGTMTNVRDRKAY